MGYVVPTYLTQSRIEQLRWQVVVAHNYVQRRWWERCMRTDPDAVERLRLAQQALLEAELEEAMGVAVDSSVLNGYDSYTIRR
jgi:hypothetical protein